MNTIKALLLIGLVFLANGVTFLVIGLSSQSSAYSTLGPTFLALGVALIATAGFRKRRTNKSK